MPAFSRTDTAPTPLHARQVKSPPSRPEPEHFRQVTTGGGDLDLAFAAADSTAAHVAILRIHAGTGTVGARRHVHKALVSCSALPTLSEASGFDKDILDVFHLLPHFLCLWHPTAPSSKQAFLLMAGSILQIEPKVLFTVM